MNECYEGHLYGKSNLISKSIGIQNHFDIFIHAIGWESRCCDITKYNSNKFSIDNTIILTFNVDKEPGYEKQFKKDLIHFYKTKKCAIHDININLVLSKEQPPLKLIARDIIKQIDDIYKKNKRSLEIGFEISSCPRRFILFLLIACLKKEFVKKISFFYSEGEYSDDFEEGLGEWEISELTEIDNPFSYSHKNLFILSSGFEEKKYRREISNYEPENIGILLPYPGFIDKYSIRAKKICKQLKKEFNIPKENIIHADAGDAISAWEQLKKDCLNKNNSNIIYFPFGPKPHVLAMGIHAYLQKNCHLMYRIPKSGYNKSEVKSIDQFWEYEIKNLVHF